VPWVSSGEVTFSRIDETREHITREAAGNPAKRIHPPGTVMLAMIGEGKTRGQAAILNIEAAHNQNCASIRVSATKVLPEYVYGYLEERYLETRRAGAGGVQQALNKAAIQRFPIPIPPLATQRSLVAAWDDVRSSVARLHSEVSRASQRSASLRRTLLAAAFSGRLTGGSDLSGAGEMNDA
jgi:type I restriction enzyme S subunit